jgi:hypothetical protein
MIALFGTSCSPQSSVDEGHSRVDGGPYQPWRGLSLIAVGGKPVEASCGAEFHDRHQFHRVWTLREARLWPARGNSREVIPHHGKHGH